MTGTVLTIGTPTDDLHDQRLRAVAAACERLSAITGAPSPGSLTPAVDLLKTLAAAGRIAVSAEDEQDGPWTRTTCPRRRVRSASRAG